MYFFISFILGIFLGSTLSYLWLNSNNDKALHIPEYILGTNLSQSEKEHLLKEGVRWLHKFYGNVTIDDFFFEDPNATKCEVGKIWYRIRVDATGKLIAVTGETLITHGIPYYYYDTNNIFAPKENTGEFISSANKNIH